MAADGSADFTLRLHNQVTAPAKAMRKSIGGLSDALREKQKVFAQGESEFQKKLKVSRRFADTAHRQELRAMRARRVAVARQAGLSARLAARDQKRRREQDAAGRSAVGGAALTGIGLPVVAAIVAAGAAAAYLGTKFVSATVAAVDFGQRSKTALTSILKDGALAAQQFAEVRMEAGKLGLNVTDTVDEFKMLANSGFKVPMARDLVRMSADLQALTGSSESASLALRAISQIKMKGRLQAEEITGQLAEHGVSADEVYKVLGKTLGKTREEILKLQKAGDLSADVAIPAIIQAVQNQLGVQQSGGFASKINVSSVGGMWRVLSAQVQNAFISLGERVGPGITRAFQSIMASIQTAIASPQMTALSSAVVQVFDAVSSIVGKTDFATLIKEAASTLATELSGAATFIRDHAAEIRESFMGFVRSMVSGMRAMTELMAPFAKFMASDFVRFMVTPMNESDNSVVRFLGSPLNETFSDKPRSAGPGFAAQAGAASRNVTVNLTGDTHITLAGYSGSPEEAGERVGDAQRRMLISYLEGGV